MLKPLLVAAVLLQVPPRPLPLPIGSAPMIPAPRVTQSGILVSGAGMVSVPATSADVTLHVSSRNNALTLNQQTLQPIVNALVSAGVARDAISIPPYMVGAVHTNMAEIVAHVDHPTEAMLRQGMLILANAFAATPDILLNDAFVTVHGDGCQALWQQAEARAIAQARQDAEFIAKQTGVHVGELLAAEEDTPPPESCARGFGIGPYGAPGMNYNFADLLTIQVRSNVQMRFAIKR
jgi:uncharacterized protein YggE